MSSYLGKTAKDIDSGYEGKIVSIVHLATKCIHVGLVKPGLNKDGLPYEIQVFDSYEIKDYAKLGVDPNKFADILGKEVIDTHTDYTGICTSVTEYHTSDSRVGIQGKHLFEGRPAKPHYADLMFVKFADSKEEKSRIPPEKKPGCSIHALRD